MLVIWRQSGVPVKIGELTVTPVFDNQNYELIIESDKPFEIENIYDNACLYKHVVMVYKNRAVTADNFRIEVQDTNINGVLLKIESLDGSDFVINFKTLRHLRPRIRNGFNSSS